MKQTLFVLILFLNWTVATYGQNSEENLIREIFDNYKSAIINGNGEEAVKYMDSRTIKYYSDILEHVKTSDSAAVENLNVLDKITVLSIRHRAPREDILNFDGKALVIFAFNSGMIGKNSVEKYSISSVAIDSSFAKAHFMANGNPTPFYFHFHKEEGKWKIDLNSLYPISEKTFKRIAEDSKQNGNGCLLSLIGIMTGEMPDNKVWHPVK
jgi:hypothetical protein